MSSEEFGSSNSRTKQFINAFGDELIIENAERAIAETSKIRNCLEKEYTVGLIYFDGITKALMNDLLSLDKILKALKHSVKH